MTAKRLGRPSSFTPAIGARICERLVEGESLRTICADDDMPSRAGVMKWLASGQYPIFLDQYTRAKEASGDTDADDVAHYARQAACGAIEPAAATAAINGLKWTAGKKAPKKYGDKVAVVGGSETDAPIRHEFSDLDRAKAVAAIVAKAKG